MSTAGDLRRGAQRVARRLRRRLRRPLSRTVVALRAPARRRVRRRLDDLRAALPARPPRPPLGSAPSATLVVVGPSRHGHPIGPSPIARNVVVKSCSVGTGPDARPNDVEVVPVEGNLASTINRIARDADTDVLILVAGTSEPLSDDWVDRLVAALGEDVVGATPLLVHPERPRWRATPDDGLTRGLGIELTVVEGEPRALAVDAGTPADPSAPSRRVDALSGACAAIDRRAFEAAGGLREPTDLDAALVDLSVRMRAAGGELAAVPAAVVVDRRPVGSAQQLRHALDPESTAWRTLVERSGPLLVRAGTGAPAGLSFTLTTAAPSASVAPRWGDWHLAQGLARGLNRLGHTVRVQSIGEVDEPASRSCDVHVVLRGKRPVRRTPGQRHVLWVISHPDLLTAEECDQADLVLVASTRHADELGRRTSTPVATFLQATDTDRFRPLPVDPAWAHPVLIVANARHVLRPVVVDALAAGLRPAIVGRGWDRLVDPALVVAAEVPNEDLARVYSSAGVLLNDHWPDMRAHGFVSNRVFDALACDTPLVSDALPELRELFGDAVATYATPSELRDRVDEILADRAAARARAATGREVVRAHHTFDHRARQLAQLLAEHGLDRPAR